MRAWFWLSLVGVILLLPGSIVSVTKGPAMLLTAAFLITAPVLGLVTTSFYLYPRNGAAPEGAAQLANTIKVISIGDCGLILILVSNLLCFA